ncbi:MAG: response regulator [Prochlorothrix sp.]|nr:response regulator [Prochlorothrix sp.]
MLLQYLRKKRQHSYWLGLLLLLFTAGTGLIVDWFGAYGSRQTQASKKHDSLWNAIQLEVTALEMQRKLGAAQAALAQQLLAENPALADQLLSFDLNRLEDGAPPTPQDIQQHYADLWIQVGRFERNVLAEEPPRSRDTATGGTPALEPSQWAQEAQEQTRPTDETLRQQRQEKEAEEQQAIARTQQMQLQVTIDQVKDTLRQIEPLIDSLDRPTTTVQIFAIYNTVSTLLSTRMADIKLLSNALKEQYEAEQLIQDRNEAQSWRIFVVMTLLTMGLLSLYVYVLLVLLDRAERVAAEKTSFVHLVSHEVRTPMNSMIGAAELLMETPLTAQQQDLSRMIRASGNALLAIINDLLDLSKLESQKLELEAQAINLGHCLDAAFDVIAANMGHKSLELTYTIDPAVPSELLGDFSRLRQVLLNLLNNAIKFTDTGQVIVAVRIRRCMPPSVTSSLAHCPSSLTQTLGSANTTHTAPLARTVYEVEFMIRDTGIGIEPDKIHRLFQPFSQADASTSRRFGGTGLGLAITKRLCELMGGTIWVESRGKVAGWPPKDWEPTPFPVADSTAPAPTSDRPPTPADASPSTQDAMPQGGTGATFYFTVTLPVAVQSAQPSAPPLDLTAEAVPFGSALRASLTSTLTPELRHGPQRGLLLSQSSTLAPFLATQLHFHPADPQPQIHTVTTLDELAQQLQRPYRFSGVFVDGRVLDLAPHGPDCQALKALWDRIEPPSIGPLLPLIWLKFGAQRFPDPQDWPMPTAVLSQPLRQSQLWATFEHLYTMKPLGPTSPLPSPNIPRSAPDAPDPSPTTPNTTASAFQERVPGDIGSTPAPYDPTATAPGPLTPPATALPSDVLPNPAPQTPETPPPPTDRSVSPALRILLVEDVPTNQKIALRFLSTLGYEADVANNGKEALTALEAQVYDVIFMDLQMPEMDGLEATDAIRQRCGNPDRPWIIAMTAHASNEARQECDKAGMNEFLTKPLRKPLLRQTIDRYLTQFRPDLLPQELPQDVTQSGAAQATPPAAHGSAQGTAATGGVNTSSVALPPSPDRSYSPTGR